MLRYIKNQLAKIPFNKIPLKRMNALLLYYAFMPLMMAYMEILLRLLTGNELWPGLPFALLFSMSAGFLISLLVSLINHAKTVRAIACVLLFAFCTVFSLQYFMFASYRVFMNFETIFLEAGNVIGEFSGVLVSVILFGIPIIIAFYMPLVLFLILTTHKRTPYGPGAGKTRINSLRMTAVLLVLAAAGQVIIINASENDGAAFHLEYNFDSSSQRLGILAGVSLDLWYNAFGSPLSEAMFTPVELNQEVVFVPSPPPAPTPMPAINDDAPPTTVEAPEPDAPPVMEPEPIEYGYNYIDIDFETLIANERNSKTRSVHEYVASLNASKQNEYTGLFEGKNLIIFTAEAFTKQVVDPVMTPTLHRLVHKGFYFSDFYQPGWGGGTSGGEFSILTGLPPTSSANSMQAATRQNISYTMGNRLMNLGYFSAA